MDQYQSRGKHLASFKGHWSIRISLKTRQRGHWFIRISPEIHMDQRLPNLSETSGLHWYRSIECFSLPISEDISVFLNVPSDLSEFNQLAGEYQKHCDSAGKFRKFKSRQVNRALQYRIRPVLKQLGNDFIAKDTLHGYQSFFFSLSAPLSKAGGFALSERACFSDERKNWRRKQHKHKFLGLDFLRTFLTLPPRMPRG